MAKVMLIKTKDQQYKNIKTLDNYIAVNLTELLITLTKELWKVFVPVLMLLPVMLHIFSSLTLPLWRWKNNHEEDNYIPRHRKEAVT